MSDFLQNAERIFETATSAAGSQSESQDFAILIGRDGAIRMVMGSDWPLYSLEAYHGAQAAYRVSRCATQVRVEGKSSTATCLLESEPIASVARRLLADRPRYLLAA